MLAINRHRSRPKLPILLLVFLLCVQSIGYAAHGLALGIPVQTGVTIQNMPCHDMPDMQIAGNSDQGNVKPVMPCCDDGNCTDTDCMMPAGTHFITHAQIFAVFVSNEIFVSNTRSLHSIKPAPPTRPPIS